jgi:glyoxylase-like metal-dependent hydrolase (beta-lactamase superfamily II)
VHERDIDFAGWRATRPDIGPIDDWYQRHGLPSGDSFTPGTGGPPRWRTTTRIEPDRRLTDGEVLRFGKIELRVIWTPGHSPGHACFYEESQELLLSGDHVLPKISPNVGLWPYGEDDPLGDYMRSLKRLRGMRVKKVLPAHEYSFDDLDARLDELEEHHRERLQEVLDAVDAGATTCYEVARRVTWSVGHFDNFNAGTRRAAMNETLSHLHYLVLEKQLRQVEEGGVVHFTR